MIELDAGRTSAFRSTFIGLLAIALAASASSAKAAAMPPAALTLNAGETYVIRGPTANVEPQVTSPAGRHPVIVYRLASGEIQILAAESGASEVRFALSDGSPVICEVTVRAAFDAKSLLAPGTTPTPISGMKLSAEHRDDGTLVASSASGPPEVVTVPRLPEEATPSHPLTPPPTESPLLPSQTAQPALAAPIEKYTTDPRAAQPPEKLSGALALPDDAISLRAGAARLFEFPNRMRRVAIGDTAIADVEVLTPHQVMLTGHQPGFTTFAIWDEVGQYEERDVRIERTGKQQVLLNAIVAEVNRTRLEQQGVDFSAALTNYPLLSLFGLPGSVATPFDPTSDLVGTASGLPTGVLPPAGSVVPLLLSNQVTYGIAAQNSNFQAQAFLQFLENHGLAKILARPQLVANSGEESKFLSGGEIPIVIAEALNTSIVFKQFGTSVVFLPTVVGRDEIQLVVKPEVSEPDFTEGVKLLGFNVPAFITRRAETTVRMRDNQTLIIAGLVLDTTTSTVRKVPYIGDVPYLGALFRSTSYEHDKTELVMSVTPRIVAPLPSNGEVKLPTDQPPLTHDELRTGPVAPPDASRPRLN